MSEDSSDSDATYKETVEVAGRSYQKFSVDQGIYHLPVDDAERQRIVDQHLMLQNIFQDNFVNRYFLPPMGRVPAKVLDCGSGQPDWALEVARYYPDSQVTAVDVWGAEGELIEYEDLDNLHFYIHNLNEPLRQKSCFRANTYDLIQSRCVTPGIKKTRWQSYINDMVRLLKPNGWIQLVEFSYLFQSWNGTLSDASKTSEWCTYYRNATNHNDLQRDLRVGATFEQKLRAAGLRDIQVRTINVDVGAWSEDTNRQRIGQQMLRNILGDETGNGGFLDSHALWAFTQLFGWTAQQVKWFTDSAKLEIRNPSYRMYMPLHIAWGRKS